MHLKTDKTSAKLTKQIHYYNVHQSPLVLEPSCGWFGHWLYVGPSNISNEREVWSDGTG